MLDDNKNIWQKVKQEMMFVQCELEISNRLTTWSGLSHKT